MWSVAELEPKKSPGFIPIYGTRGLRGQEAPALAGGPCTARQAYPPAFLARTRGTVDELPCLVPPSEGALSAQKASGDARHYFRMHLIRWPLIVKSG